MAFSAQIPSNERMVHNSWLDPLFMQDLRKKEKDVAIQRNYIDTYSSMYSDQERVRTAAPSLCFQSDVFYPNALAAVLGEEMSIENDFSTSSAKATGCRGHQVQRDFPLEPRVAVAVPLVQYPSPVSDLFVDQTDICALPVLNWEKYICNFKMTVSSLKFREPPVKPNSQSEPEPESASSRSESRGNSNSNTPNPSGPPSDASDDEDIPETGVENDDDDVSDSEQGDSAEVVMEQENEVPEPGIPKPAVKEKGLSYLQKMLKKYEKNRPSGKSVVARVRNELIKHDKLKKLERSVSGEGKSDDSIWKKPTSSSKKPRINKIPLMKLNNLKNVPKFRMDATWNYAYGGANGACCISSQSGVLNIFTGNKTQVRRVVLENTGPSSMLTHRVHSVWEEEIENVPTNEDSHPLSDIVLQCTFSFVNNNNILGVRRGKSIEFYSTETESPYLLESVPNVRYGTRQYTGCPAWLDKTVTEDPLLLGLDFNPLFSPEFLTIDENAQLRICDATKGTTITNFHIPMSHPHRPTPMPSYPKFNVFNNGIGAQFGHQGQTFYAWADSKVTLGDRRDGSRSRTATIELFNLRQSTSSLSWSDQANFNDTKVHLHEYISSLKLSTKENYYYVGTTSRVFLFDARVPDHPVLKMEHGLQEAAYLSTCSDGSYEVVVAGSQRMGTIFSAITDHAHVQCHDRPDCKASNPVLHCLPRHLSNSREFFESVCSSGYDQTWEAEFQRAKQHNFAWMSGLCATRISNPRSARDPAGIMVFTSNSYGDIFYQEWDQKPIVRHLKTSVQDLKYLKFLKSWTTAMKSNENSEFLKPSLNVLPRQNYSFLVETSARGVSKMARIREEPFDGTQPDEIMLHDAAIGLPPLSKRAEKLKRQYKTDIAERCLDFWQREREEPSDTVKQEPADNDEEEYDAGQIEFLSIVQRVAPDFVELDSGPTPSTEAETLPTPTPPAILPDDVSEEYFEDADHTFTTVGPIEAETEAAEHEMDFEYSEMKDVDYDNEYNDFFENTQPPVAPVPEDPEGQQDDDELERFLFNIAAQRSQVREDEICMPSSSQSRSSNTKRKSRSGF